MNIKSIFATKETTSPPAAGLGATHPKKAGETYQSWGKRICATVSGNNITLSTFLHNVYNYIYKEQADNEALQKEMHRQIQGEIAHQENEIELFNKQIDGHQKKINDHDRDINNLQAQKTELKAKGFEISRPAKAKMVLGVVILAPLTFYLFLFYSSTFFSAFLAGGMGNDITNAAGAMFNPDCFELTWISSKSMFFFMLCFPVIFLGLGFGLHFFSLEKGWKKYPKMIAIVLVTFTFDCILAYQIGENIHTWMFDNGHTDIAEYTLAMAIQDVNTWAVIFCGFIAYIIWGIVFDQTMEAYGDLDKNSILLQSIDSKIQQHHTDKGKEQNAISQLHTDVKNSKNKIVELTKQLQTKVYIDNNAIKTEMNNFFSGWMACMGFIGCSLENQQEAKDVYQQTIETLFN